MSAVENPLLAMLDGSIEDFDRALDRTCRWCGGDGLDPFLPTRIRQFFTHGATMTVEVWHDFAGSFQRREEESRLLGAVAFWNPLNEFLEDVSAELRGRTDVIYTPFDLVGRTYHGLRCPRCRGTGRLPRVVV